MRHAIAEREARSRVRERSRKILCEIMVAVGSARTRSRDNNPVARERAMVNGRSEK
jgi:hypothetical protein